MKKRDEYEEEYESSKREKRIDRIAEELVEAVEFNAWEYGNTGNFLYNWENALWCVMAD